METDESIGARIRELRLLRGFSQADLAERLPDFTARIVMKIEQGARSLKLSEAAAMARILDVDVDDLLAPSALLDYEELATSVRIHVEEMYNVINRLWVLSQSYNNLQMVLRAAPPLSEQSDMVTVELVETAMELLSQTSRLEDVMDWANQRVDLDAELAHGAGGAEANRAAAAARRLESFRRDGRFPRGEYLCPQGHREGVTFTKREGVRPSIPCSQCGEVATLVVEEDVDG